MVAEPHIGQTDRDSTGQVGAFRPCRSYYVIFSSFHKHLWSILSRSMYKDNYDIPYEYLGIRNLYLRFSKYSRHDIAYALAN